MGEKISLKYSKGFTLIELLVVIAIIGILATIVLASLNTARDKGSDSAVKGNLNNMHSQAESLYDTLGTGYQFICGDEKMTALKEAAIAAGGAGNCNSNPSRWAAWAVLKWATSNAAPGTTRVWCVDSTGQGFERDKPPGVGNILSC